MLRASLIIATLDRQEFLRSLVSTLAGQSEQGFETIIVDQTDAPDPVLKSLADSSGGKLRYLHLTRKSLPNARNAGAAAARGEVLIFIDDDVELSPTLVAGHLSRYAEAGVAAVAGRITGGYDGSQGEGYVGPRRVGSLNLWTGRVVRNFHVRDTHESVDGFTGCNFSVRRETYFNVGGFDVPPREGMSGHIGGPSAHAEETEFACRIRKAGGRICFEPSAYLVHLCLPRGGCRDPNRRRWTWWHAHNSALLLRRHGRFWQWPVGLWVAGIRYLAHALRHRDIMLWPMGVGGALIGFFGAKKATPFKG